MKDKLSISMDEETVHSIQKHLEGGRFRSVSHLVEYAVRHFLQEVDDDQ